MIGKGTEVSVWVPFLAAVAGGVLGSLSSLGGIWLTGRQRRYEQTEERSLAAGRDIDRIAAATVTSLQRLLIEGSRAVENREVGIDDTQKAMGAAMNSLVLLFISHPDQEIADLCRSLYPVVGGVNTDCRAVLAGEIPSDGFYKEGSWANQLADKIDDLMERLRSIKMRLHQAT